MRKVLIGALVVLLVGFVTTSYSQTASFGSKLGIVMANLSFDPDLQSSITKSSRTGFTGGAAFELMFSGIPLGVEVDLFYTMAGAEFEGPIFATEQQGPVTGKLKEKISLIQIPVLLKGKFETGSAVSPYVYVGPSLGIVASAKAEREPTGFPSDELDVKDQTSSTDFELIFGGGAQFQIESKVALTFDVRYGLGMTNMIKDAPSGSQTEKTTGLSFLIGCMFVL